METKSKQGKRGAVKKIVKKGGGRETLTTRY
jgi:hypothetical protein